MQLFVNFKCVIYSESCFTKKYKGGINMKKKLIIGVIAAIVLLCGIVILNTPRFYLEYEVSDYYMANGQIYDEDCIRIKNCKNYVVMAKIPDKIEGLPVREIDQSAFMDKKLLTYVDISDSVKVVDNYAFCNCTSLKKINLPKSIKYIGNSAFMECKKLKKIEFSDSLKRIDAHAFENCSSLKEIKIPDSVEIIEYKAFANCTSLEKAVLPDSESTTLENCVFLKCPNLSEVIIPDKLINFNASSFKKCESLENWSINGTNPNFVKYNDAIYTNDYKKLVFYSETAEKFEIHPDTEIIGEFAFSYNYKLENIVIPEHIKIIEEKAFYNSPNLKTVKFENGAKTISEGAFMYCPELQEVILSDTVETIGEEAFYVCDNLKEIIIPASVKVIGNKSIGLSTQVYDEGEMFGLDSIYNNNIIINGFKNSVAEKYAKENDIEFIPLD